MIPELFSSHNFFAAQFFFFKSDINVKYQMLAPPRVKRDGSQEDDVKSPAAENGVLIPSPAQ
jgi:hypothetical protein